MTLVLLGKTYLQACQIPSLVHLPCPTFFLTGQIGCTGIPEGTMSFNVKLTQSDTRTFGAGYVSLKGAVAGSLLRFLRRVESEPVLW